MLVPKKDRIAIYTYLFKEGVMCTNDCLTSTKVLGKDANDKEIVVKNLYVIKLLKGLCSKKCVEKVYSWKWFYYTLTEDGVNYLRDYLHIPSDVVPATFKRDQETESHIINNPKLGSSEGGYRKQVAE